MNPTLTAQNGNIMTGTLPANASGFNAQGDIIYNTQPNVPLGSAVMTSAPASEAYKQSAGWLANEQNQAAVRKANADLAAKTAAAEAAKGKIQNKTTQVATDALEGFVRTSNTAALSPSEQARMAQIEQITGQLQTLAQGMDARAGAQVESVIKEYQGLTQRQEVANKAYEGGTSVAGLSSGRSRYASEIQAGVQSAAVASGIQALTDIQAKKERLIMEIENARDEKKYKTMTEAVANLKDLNKMERQAAQDMKDDFYKEQTYMRENSKFQSEQNAPYIASQLTGDPVKDNAIFEASANQLGVSYASLVGAVDKYKQDLSKLTDTPDIREFNFAIQRGEIPKNANFESWIIKRANDKVKASGGTGNEKVDKEAASAFTLYGQDMLDAIKNSASPAQAVRVAAALAKDNGDSISLAAQSALLDYLNAAVQGGSNTPAPDIQAPLPGETSSGGFFDFFDANQIKADAAAKSAESLTGQARLDYLRSRGDKLSSAK